MSIFRLCSWFISASIFLLFILCAVSAQATPDASSYNRPLLFAPEDNNIFLTSPQLKWDLEKNILNFGGISFDGSRIKFLSSTHNGRTNIGFAWPTNLANSGKVELRVDGKSVWSYDVDPSDVSGWKNKLKTNPDLKELQGTVYGIIRPGSTVIDALKAGTSTQACFTKKKSETEWLEICSAINKASVGEQGELMLEPQLSEIKSGVRIFDQDFGPRGAANFPGTKPVQFAATFSDGGTLSFSLLIPQLKMLDVVWKGEQQTGKEYIVFTGQGAKPLGEVKNLVVPPHHFWSATGLDEEVIWQTTIPKESPLLRVIAPFNIPFTYIVQFTDLPDETDRIYISDRTGAGTYSGSPKIYGTIPSQAKLSSHEASVRKSSLNEFEWKFSAPNKGERNKARISLFKNEDGKEKEWVANYQLYRGYPFQAALRLTGLTNDKLQTSLVGEASLTYFPDTIFLNSYLLDYHRWGFSARYFQTITPLTITQTDESTGDTAEIELKPFKTANIDARYNLRPGLWNRDELFGPLVSYSDVAFINYNAQALGFGAFWARTMPLFLDNLLNLNPLFRYPKYVDIEIIYYPFPMGSDYISSGTMFVNFQGRVFFSKRFFAEGGFGMKQFKYVPNENSGLKPLDLIIGYGTAGIGFTF